MKGIVTVTYYPNHPIHACHPTHPEATSLSVNALSFCPPHPLPPRNLTLLLLGSRLAARSHVEVPPLGPRRRMSVYISS